MFRNIKINNHILIILSALLMAFLFEINSISYLFEAIRDKKIAEMNNVELLKMRSIIYSIIGFVISFYIIAIFNIILRNWIYQYKNIKIWIVPIMIIANILIIILLTASIEYIYDMYQRDMFNEQLANKKKFIKQFYLNFSSILKLKHLITPVLAIIFAYLLILIRKSRDTELEITKLKQERTNVELASLKEQISPHFFFNTLNSLSSIIRTGEKSESLDFVDSMSQVYRYTLDSGNNDLVTISDELEFINSYSVMLKKRFGNNLQIKINIDKKKREGKIPPMALQILFENVIKHNNLSDEKPIILQIDYKEDFITVQNNIIIKESVESHGLGLAKLNKRYQMLSDTEIEINQTEEFFRVKLPIIKV